MSGKLMQKYEILKVIVGSQAHGLANPESDIDYRSVYALPTSQILSLNHKYKGASWVEGENEDNTAWEIGHFLSLAFQCNPTILEVFLAPYEGELSTLGLELRGLFQYIWTPQKCFDAFTGYGKNQQKKFLDKKDKRPAKYAAAHIRTLVNLIELLNTGLFTVDLKNHPMYPTLRRIKSGYFSVGEVVNLTEDLTQQAEKALEACPFTPLPDEARYKIVNMYLLDIRKMYW